MDLQDKTWLLALVLEQCLNRGMSVKETMDLFSAKNIEAGYKILRKRENK